MKKLMIFALLLFTILVPIHTSQASIFAANLQNAYVSANTATRSYYWWYKYIPQAPTTQTWTQTPTPAPPPVPASIPASVPTPAPNPAPTPVPNPSSTQSSAPLPNPVPTANSAAQQNEMLGYINAERAKANVPSLALEVKLSNGAYLKSKDMAVNNYFAHTSPTYGSPFDMMKSLGITYHAAGENIAMNVSVIGAQKAFMNSSGHRANILNSTFHKIGLGFYQSGGYLYVTQWFTD